MKKIVIDHAIYSNLTRGGSLLDREDVQVFIGKTNNELLALHRKEKANLIIARLDAGGMPCESLFDEIRHNDQLRVVSLILFCGSHEKARAERCAPNAVMTLPVSSTLVLEKARSFLNISSRGAYRVLLNVAIDASKDKSFFCKSENISASGLLLETDRELQAGNRLHCSFFLPDAKRIETTAEVVRVLDPAGKPGMKKYGVKFVQIAPGDSVAIQHFVEKKSGKN